MTSWSRRRIRAHCRRSRPNNRVFGFPAANQRPVGGSDRGEFPPNSRYLGSFVGVSPTSPLGGVACANGGEKSRFQPQSVGSPGRQTPVYWANDLFLRRALSLAAVMAESGRSPAPGLTDMATRALLYRRPHEPKTLLITHGSQYFAIRLRRHRRARRYTLRIHPSDREAILTMPPRGTLAEAKDFAQRHGAWIAARLGRLPKAAPFQPGTVIPLRGVSHRIVHRAGTRGTVWTEVRDSGERILCVAGGVEHADRRVSDFLKREARRDLQRAANPMPPSSASRSSGSRSAINRAAGAPAPRPARCRSPGA